MAMTFAIRNLNLMLAKLKDYFINFVIILKILFFKQIGWSNFKMMSFPKTSGASVPAFYPQILVSKLICFQMFAPAQK